MFELQIELDSWRIWKHHKYGTVFISKACIRIPGTNISIDTGSPGDGWSLDSDINSFGWRFISSNSAVYTDWRLGTSEQECVESSRVWVSNTLSIRDSERSTWQSYIDSYK